MYKILINIEIFFWGLNWGYKTKNLTLLEIRFLSDLTLYDLLRVILNLETISKTL